MNLDPTPAEQRLIDAAARGEVADYRVGDEEADNPASGENWAADRILRAEIIYALCAGTRPNWQVHAKGVFALGARIVGDLDFDAATLSTRLALIGCRIDGPISLRDARTRTLVFAGSHCGGINADRLVVEGSVSLRNGFVAKGEVRLRGADTRALLVSHWPVETTSAKMLTTGVFRRQAEDPKLSRTEALQHTMLALMDGPGYVHSDTGKTVFSYAHPMFWAPFAIIGDGGPASGKRPVSAIGHVALTEAVPSATPQTSAAIVSRTMPGKPPTAHYIMLKNSNVREGPSTNSPKVTMLRKGTQITVLGEAPDGWYRIARDGRELGFVYGKLIAPLQ
jgi:hypothetical protein